MRTVSWNSDPIRAEAFEPTHSSAVILSKILRKGRKLGDLDPCHMAFNDAFIIRKLGKMAFGIPCQDL
ncbi:MAG: hypothetical protein EBZ67_03055 [Chitinophagia bacterium]|nr:hypothetical protein [Chitinophagia bacterium]